MFQLLDPEHKIATYKSSRISKASRQKGVPKMTRHEESRTEGRLARGTKLQIEDKWV